MARLRSKIWVQAYLKRLELQTIAAYVMAHGDDHSGAILVKISKMDGFAELHQKTFDLQNNRNVKWNWVKGHAGNLGNERADELARMGIEKI